MDWFSAAIALVKLKSVADGPRGGIFDVEQGQE
jgi:hypothetical protein